MKADPFVQRRLLDLQTLDSALLVLAARRRNVPEIAEIERLGGRLSALEDEVTRAETEAGDLARQQAKLENEVELVRTRADRDRERLQAGRVGSPRELENLQSEIESLGRRQSSLEDDLLELMEAHEAADERAGAFAGERDAVVIERGVAETRRDEAFERIDVESQERRAERDGLAPSFPADLLALYERLRAANAGVGAAALLRRRCEGCHLEQPGSALRDIAAAPSDEVLRCEECGRILVRTEESGL